MASRGARSTHSSARSWLRRGGLAGGLDAGHAGGGLGAGGLDGDGRGAGLLGAGPGLGLGGGRLGRELLRTSARPVASRDGDVLGQGLETRRLAPGHVALRRQRLDLGPGGGLGGGCGLPAAARRVDVGLGGRGLGPGRREPGLGLGERRSLVGAVELDQQVAGLHRAPLHGRELEDAGGDPRRDVHGRPLDLPGTSGGAFRAWACTQRRTPSRATSATTTTATTTAMRRIRRLLARGDRGHAASGARSVPSIMPRSGRKTARGSGHVALRCKEFRRPVRRGVQAAHPFPAPAGTAARQERRGNPGAAGSASSLLPRSA